MSPEVAAIAAALHRLATSTSPDADRCADALAALVEARDPPRLPAGPVASPTDVVGSASFNAHPTVTPIFLVR